MAATEIGASIRAVRLLAGLSQEALAERAFLSPRTVSDIERGIVASPRRRTLQSLADAMSVSVDLLVAARESGEHVERQGGAPVGLLGELVRSARTGLGLTQRELAQRAGVGERTVSDIERHLVDRTRPRTAVRIAHALNLGGDELKEFMRVAGGSTYAAPLKSGGLLGRSSEIGHVLGNLAQHSFVTICGSGGVGKTSLARAVAANLPALWVTLTDAPVGADLTGELLHRLGQQQVSSSDLGSMLDAELGDRSLLILDNLEQVTGVEVLSTLLAQRPTLRIPGNVADRASASGETVFTLGGLDPKSAADLFVECAGAVGRSVDSGDRIAILEICRKLWFVPLPIELAAAQTRYLAVNDVVQRLDESLAMSTHRRDAADRHRSVVASIEWSVALLSAEARTLFDELAVHPGDFSLAMVDAFHQSATGSVGAMAELVDAHLVTLDTTSHDTWYRMHASVRQVARGRLAEDRRSSLESAAAEHVLELAESAGARLPSPEQPDWLRRLDAFEPRFQPAVRHYLETDPASAARVTAGLWRYWQLRGMYRRGADLIGDVLERSASAPASLDVATSTYGLAVLTYLGGDVVVATGLALSALEGYEEQADGHGIGSTCSLLGMIDRYAGRLRAALSWFDRGLAAVGEENPRARAALVANHAVALGALGDLDRAISQGEDAVARFEILGDRREVADQLCNLAGWRSEAGESRAAAALFDEAIGVFSDLEEDQGLADATAGRGRVWLRAGDVERASEDLESAEALHGSLDDDWGRALDGIARAEQALLAGDPDGAVRLARTALRRAGDLDYWDALLVGGRCEALPTCSEARASSRPTPVDAWWSWR